MDLFQFAERYPQAPGYRQTDTSKAAAESMKPTREMLRDRVLRRLKLSACTPDECAAFMGAAPLAVRPRFTELKLEGLIEDTGDRRRNESGRRAIVWRLAPKH